MNVTTTGLLREEERVVGSRGGQGTKLALGPFSHGLESTTPQCWRAE